MANASDFAAELNIVALSGSYRLNRHWSFSAFVPFVDGVTEEQGQADIRINGLGDVSVSAIYSPWSGEDSWLAGLGFNAGLILPTGESSDDPNVGVVNPHVFQLGTGATQLTLGASYFGQVDEDWSYFTSVGVSLPLHEGRDDFLPAETFSWQLGTSRKLTENLSAKLTLSLFHGERDEFLDQEIGNTGSTTLSLAPALSYALTDKLTTSLSVTIPVYRRANETALVVGPLWSAGMNYRF